jgi:hypothetical protein
MLGVGDFKSSSDDELGGVAQPLATATSYVLRSKVTACQELTV